MVGLPPSARRAAELRISGTLRKGAQLSVAARAFEALTEQRALVAFAPPQQVGLTSDSALAAAPSAAAASGRAFRGRAPSHTQATGAAPGLEGYHFASARVLPHSAPAPASALPTDTGELAPAAADDDPPLPLAPAPADEPSQSGAADDAQDGVESGGRRGPKEIALAYMNSFKDFVIGQVMWFINWRPPSVKRVVENTQLFCSNFCAGFRSDHTLISFIAPADDDEEALNDMQVVQLFWSTLMIDLYLNFTSYSPPAEPAPGPAPEPDPNAEPEPEKQWTLFSIGDLVQGIFTAVVTVYIVLGLRAIFRWGNKRKIKRGGGVLKILSKIGKVLISGIGKSKRGGGKNRRRKKARNEADAEALTDGDAADPSTTAGDAADPSGDAPPTPPASPPGAFALAIKGASASAGAPAPTSVDHEGTASVPASTPKVRVVELTKTAGSPAGVGLRAVGELIAFAYIEESSALAGLVEPGEQLVSINGSLASTLGKKEVGVLLREGDDLKLEVQSVNTSMALVLPTVPAAAAPSAAAAAPSAASAVVPVPKRWKLQKRCASVVDFGRARADAEATGKLVTKEEMRQRRTLKKMERAQERSDVKAKLKEVMLEAEIRSDFSYNLRQGTAWFLNIFIYLIFLLYGIIYAGMFGPEATAGIIEGWFVSLFMAMGVLEPFNIFMVALLPVILSEDGMIYKCYMNVFFFYNEYIA